MAASAAPHRSRNERSPRERTPRRIVVATRGPDPRAGRAIYASARERFRCAGEPGRYGDVRLPRAPWLRRVGRAYDDAPPFDDDVRQPHGDPPRCDDARLPDELWSSTFCFLLAQMSQCPRTPAPSAGGNSMRQRRCRVSVSSVSTPWLLWRARDTAVEQPPRSAIEGAAVRQPLAGAVPADLGIDREHTRRHADTHLSAGARRGHQSAGNVGRDRGGQQGQRQRPMRLAGPNRQPMAGLNGKP
jgi:hypothetical protein